ncbi:ROK family protein [Paenibacillus sp. HN-1]|uniref:ROK family protein n=1 Tax=Paenibacillus TaxID=44249 RepID=UPI001CA95C04|nr:MULTISPECIES: ROK family protein [Paenibacillus]MBY9080204.1 ROK family protein [Paenibacillus sp. CGMCC 1.18879]MBY9083137.1 ROK family protein [Paenibacillus sinensis]
MIPKSHNTLQVKKINVELVKNTLKAVGTGTKASIANMTRLSVATCGTILNELVESGEVLERELEESSGGRPARQYMFNADYAYVLCLLVKTEGGRHSITYALVNLIGEKVEEGIRSLSYIDAATIDALIGEFVEKYNNIKAIGIGIPGVAHHGVIGICDVDPLAGEALGPRLEDKYNIDIIIENDMNLTVYGFYNLQNLEEDKTFAVVTFPNNHFPGAGFIVNGRIVTGTTNFAGEISYFPFGFTREEQLERLHNKEEFVSVAVQLLSSIITIINPVAIAITGDLTDPSMSEDMVNGCLRYIPKEHLPTLLIKNNTQEEYMTGIITLTLESLTYRLQLVERR